MPEREYIYRGRIINLALEGRYEIVEHAHAVAILAERDDKVLFVRQYRPAVKAATLEIPAGLINPGETPEEAARRELAEEAQLGGALEFLAAFYLSPGFCDEKLHVFRATHLVPASAQPDDDEDLSVEWLEPQGVLRAARAGEVEISASTMAGILFHLNRHAAD
ncbi:MAG: NUDIX hydrolase [Thermaceae bacterium]|nr:NUDIX hydrolase [Thermaceae bacterium]